MCIRDRCSSLAAFEKSFGENHSLSSSPSSMAKFGMVSASFLTIVVLPEQGNPVIHKQKAIENDERITA